MGIQLCAFNEAPEEVKRLCTKPKDATLVSIIDWKTFQKVKGHYDKPGFFEIHEGTKVVVVFWLRNEGP